MGSYNTDWDASAGTRRWVDTNVFGRNQPKEAGGGLGEQYAALTRQMWSDYVTQFVPFENRLIDLATNTAAPGEAMAEASGLVDKSFTAQRGATDRRLRGLGLTLDADEQKAADRSYGMAKSLADVTAQNVAREQTVARQQGVIGNPAPTAGSIKS